MFSDSARSSLRILVLGYIIRGPLGGMTWHHLQYLLGLRSLGHDVYFLEDSGDTEQSCYNPTLGTVTRDPTFGLTYADEVFSRVGLNEKWAYYDALSARWLGPAASTAVELTRTADVVVNLSYSNSARPWIEMIPVRILVDTDPVFTQIRNLTQAVRVKELETYNAFFSFGENIASGLSTVPDDGIPWLATRQPVALEEWPCLPIPVGAPLTTVMQWDSYPAREWEGRTFGLKSTSFWDVVELPRLVDVPLSIALGSPSSPRDLLSQKGWDIVDPIAVSRDPWSYQHFIQVSGGEFSVAKHGYVVSRSGWFSERTANYMATGRPVVVQETGFSDWLPSGMGVLPFTTLEDAVVAIDRLHTDPGAHARAARELAEEYFEAKRVLQQLFDAGFAAAQATG